MELSKTAYTILGFLQSSPRTGYEIKSLVDVSTRFFWAASYGQIYPELARLEEQGLVRGKADPTSGRGRKSYEITAAGRGALHDWLTSDAPPQFELRHEGVLKFFFSDSLTPAEKVAQLTRLREEHERVRDRLESIRPSAAEKREQGLSHPLMTLEWGIHYQQAIIDWCSEMERRLSEGS